MKKYVSYLLLVLAGILLSACSEKLQVTEEQVKADLVGQSLYLSGDEVKLIKENITGVTIEKQESENDAGSVVANVKIEILEEEAGEKNEQKRKNHILHIYSGFVNLDYMLNDKKEWMLVSMSPLSQMAHTEKEVANLIDPIPPFEKTSEEVLKEFQTTFSETVFVEDDEAGMTYVTFRTDAEEAGISRPPATNIRQFEVGTPKEGSYPLELLVPIKTDFDFTQNALFDMYETNGDYSAKGEFIAVYELVEDEETGDLEWTAMRTDTDSDFTITQHNSAYSEE